METSVPWRRRRSEVSVFQPYISQRRKAQVEMVITRPAQSAYPVGVMEMGVARPILGLVSRQVFVRLSQSKGQDRFSTFRKFPHDLVVQS